MLLGCAILGRACDLMQSTSFGDSAPTINPKFPKLSPDFQSCIEREKLMAYFTGGSRALTNLASKARSAIQCCKGTSLASEMALGNASRSMPSACPGSSPANSCPSALLGNRRLTSYLSRLPKEVACIQSLLPLYSVTASSRLVSQLSTNAGTAPANLHDLSSLKPR